MTQCPDCKSESIQSKGLRIKDVHRYLCNSCGRNFTIDTRLKKELPIKNKEEVDSNSDSEMTTIQISMDIKLWLHSIKLIPQEPNNAVLKRIREQLNTSKTI